MKRRFKVVARLESGTISGIFPATDHRNAVQMMVNMHQFPAGTEVDVIEIPSEPAMSTYRVFDHTSKQIEMKT